MAVVVDLEAVEIEEQDRWPDSGIAWRRAATQPLGEAWRDREHYAQQVSAGRVGSEAGVPTTSHAVARDQPLRVAYALDYPHDQVWRRAAPHIPH